MIMGYLDFLTIRSYISMAFGRLFYKLNSLSWVCPSITVCLRCGVVIFCLLTGDYGEILDQQGILLYYFNVVDETGFVV